MRASARMPVVPGDAASTRETEGARWLVEYTSDTTVRVTIDLGGTVVQHGGTIASVRARLAIDAETRDRTPLDVATRDAATGGRAV